MSHYNTTFNNQNYRFNVNENYLISPITGELIEITPLLPLIQSLYTITHQHLQYCKLKGWI